MTNQPQCFLSNNFLFVPPPASTISPLTAPATCSTFAIETSQSRANSSRDLSRRPQKEDWLPTDGSIPSGAEAEGAGPQTVALKYSRAACGASRLIKRRRRSRGEGGVRVHRGRNKGGVAFYVLPLTSWRVNARRDKLTPRWRGACGRGLRSIRTNPPVSPTDGLLFTSRVENFRRKGPVRAVSLGTPEVKEKSEKRRRRRRTGRKGRKQSLSRSREASWRVCVTLLAAMTQKRFYTARWRD